MEPKKITIEITEEDYQGVFKRKPKSQEQLDTFADSIKYSVKRFLRTIYYDEEEE